MSVAAPGGFDGGDGPPPNKFWFNPMSFLDDDEDDEEEEEDKEDMIRILKRRPNSREMRLAKRRKTRRQQFNKLC